ncbi:MAG: protein-export chaperone SecB [Pseudomonadota bacterium]
MEKLYVKDVSFETPNSPDIFMAQPQAQPQIDLQLNSTTQPIKDDLHEVSLNATVTFTSEDKTAFLVEVQQAGIFTLANFSPEQMAYMANSFCPNVLFPYLRECISDLVTRGGFPPLLLDPINFDAVYAQRVQQQQQQQGGQIQQPLGQAPIGS